MSARPNSSPLTRQVEIDEQKTLLVGMGCHQLQGYLPSPPLEPGQLLVLPGLSSGVPERTAARA